MTIAKNIIEPSVTTFNAVADTASVTLDVAVATKQTIYLRAEVIGEYKTSPANVNHSFRRVAECVVNLDGGGSAAFATAIASSNNPSTSTNLAASDVQVCDAEFQSGGGSPSTIAWSVTGANARLTITNQGNGHANDFVVFLDKNLIEIA